MSYVDNAEEITLRLMHHYGYTDEEMDAEPKTCREAGCEQEGWGFDHEDENGKPRHPIQDELADSAAIVMFVLEELEKIEAAEAERDAVIAVPDVWGYVTTRWPDTSPMMQTAKVAEEAGEAVGAAIKNHQNRGDTQAITDELADVIIAAIGALQCGYRDPAAVVAARWDEVRQR